MASDGFLQSLWEKPIWEGVWPYLHGEPFFLLDTEGTGNGAGR